jgi:aldose sugar dehydrogenase
MSQKIDSKTADVSIKRGEQQSVHLSSVSQFFDIKTIQDNVGFGPGKGLTSWLGCCCSSIWFIFSLLHPKVIFNFFIHIADSNPIALPKRARIVSLWVPFLFVIILLANLPVGAAGQEDTDEEEAEDTDEEEAEDTDEEEAEDTDEEEAEDTDEEEAPAQPEVDPLRIPADDEPHAVRDPDLRIEELATGLKRPTAMAFLGDNDIIVTEKDNGTVRRVIDGVLQPEPLVDVAVANDNNTNERGLLGLAVAKQSETTTYVLIYYTESGGGQDGDDADGIVPAGNRLYRYELVEDPDSGSAQLINPKLLLDLPARPGPRYNAGPMLVSQNQNGTIIYLMIGDLDHHRSQSENYEDGPPPDGTGGIMAIDIEGNPLPNPVLLGQVNTEEENGDEENSGEDIGWLPYYFAYGLRNGFGMAFDPVTGYIWDTENGPDWFDEINLVRPGFNSGWASIQGPSSRPENEGADVEDLEDFGGTGVYREPEFAWQNTVGVTAINFLNSTALGEQYANDMFVADINNGRLYHFDLNQDRTGLLLEAPLEDKVADTVPELDSVIFGTGFRSISDIEVGPDGYLYLLLFGPGKIMRIAPASAEG